MLHQAFNGKPELLRNTFGAEMFRIKAAMERPIRNPIPGTDENAAPTFEIIGLPPVFGEQHVCFRLRVLRNLPHIFTKLSYKSDIFVPQKLPQLRGIEMLDILDYWHKIEFFIPFDLDAKISECRERQIHWLHRDALADENWSLWKAGETSNIHALKSALIGFEMVVASTNNVAVENISRELPKRDSLREPWRSERYLQSVAYKIAAQRNERKFVKLASGDVPWGLFSCVLGKSKNRFHRARARQEVPEQTASFPA